MIAKEILTQDVTYKQKQNSRYKEQVGAKNTFDVIEGFGKGWLVFAIISVVASAFSIYHDLYESIGWIIALIVAVALGATLEVFRHLAIKGIFSSMNGISRALLGVIGALLMSVALATHFKSLNTYKQQLIKHDLKDEITRQRHIQDVQNRQISQLLASSTEVSKAMNNGTSADDEKVATTVQSNNTLIATLTALANKNNTGNTNALLSQSKKTAETTKDTLFLLFCVVEFLAVFSILSKFLLHINTDENVKEIVTTMDKLATMENNTKEMVVNGMIHTTESKINTLMNGQSNHPTLPQSTNQKEARALAYQEKKTAQIGFVKQSIYNSGYMGEYNMNPQENDSTTTSLPVASHPNIKLGETTILPQVSDTSHHPQKEENLNEESILGKEQNSTENEPKIEARVIDLMMFNHDENDLLKLLFDNGAVEEGDKLIPKRLVLAQTKINEGVLINLYNKLLDLELIEFKRGQGYRALATIKNKVMAE